MTGRSPASLRKTALDHLQRAADAGQRVAHLVRDDRGQLSELGERGLLAQLGLGGLARRDVVADREVLSRLAALVDERHDRRVDPVEVAVLRPVPNLAAPHLAVRDRAPERPDERRRVIAGVDDAMVLADQLLAGVAGDLAELVVDVGDEAVADR